MLQRLRLGLSIVGLAIVGAACVLSFRGPTNIDFAAFWALPPSLPYPPPYRLLLEPLGALPYGVAFTLWVCLTGALWIAVFRRPHPLAVFNGLIGQNGLLTSAIVVGGLELLSANPAVGGAILGCMILKPHLAVLLPVAVIAGRKWKAIAPAFAVASLWCLAGLFAFGVSGYERSFANAAHYAANLRSGVWSWDRLASVYGLFRWLGAGDLLAMLFQGAAAITATVVVAIAWRRDVPGKVALTATASLLVSPYVFSYDCLLLAACGNPVVWLLACLPLLGSFGLYHGPNLLPIAALIALGWPMPFVHRSTLAPTSGDRSGAQTAEAEAEGLLSPAK